jgi:hypothetical protein
VNPVMVAKEVVMPATQFISAVWAFLAVLFGMVIKNLLPGLKRSGKYFASIFILYAI